jgi:ATP-dependent exoDNAse (exonuclease V) beta subunit
VETLAELRESAERDPADAFVERLRVGTGIELTEASRYLGPYRAANLDQFFRDVRNHLEETGGDVSEVLRRVRRAVDEQAEVEEARPRDAADEAVRVMSIHKAKGLDFDHVYLLQLHKGQGGGRPVTAVGRGEDGDEYQILGTASVGYDTAERQRARTEDAERVRTLYVAMTRARDRLVLVGKHPRKGDGLANSHARLLGPAEPEKGRTVEARMSRLAAEGAAAERDADGVLWRYPDLDPERARRRRDDAADPPAWPSPAELGEHAVRLARRREAARAHAARPRAQAASALSHEAHRERVHARRFPEEDAAPVPEAPPRDAARAAAVGTALHAALERWDAGAEIGTARAMALARVDAALPALVGASELAAARTEAERILDRFVASPLLDRLREIDAHVVARELPVLLRPRPGDDAVGHVVGAIDLLYRDPETGAWVVADYKSDEVSSDAELRERAARYAGQGGAYVRAVHEALGLDAPPRFELWFLARGERVTVEVAG